MRSMPPIAAIAWARPASILSCFVTSITTGWAPIWAAVSAGFEFDVPVRFDTDRIAVSVASFEAGEVPQVPVVEVRQ